MSDSSAFGKFVPGFEFMQNLARQATGGLAQGVQQAVPQLPSLSSWVAPTFNVEELEKRIEELKAVHFWLDQNTRALSATIQALEVQKMTLSTLKGMNFSLGDVAKALQIKPAAAGSTPFAGLEVPPPRRAAPAPEPQAPAKAAAPRARKAQAAGAAPGVVDPMQWWGALSQQFQTIATNAMQDASRQTAMDASKNMASALTREAVKTATEMTASVARGLKTPGQVLPKKRAAAPAARTTGTRKTTGRSRKP